MFPAVNDILIALTQTRTVSQIITRRHDGIFTLLDKSKKKKS